jgi:hypothetical protein
MFDTTADEALADVRAVLAQRDAAVAAAAFAVADAMMAGAFEASGLPSARRWLAVYSESGSDDARRLTAVANHFARHPATRQAVECGELSIARAVAVALTVTDRRRAHWRAHEGDMLPALAVQHRVEDVELVMAHWAATVDDDIEPSVPREQRLHLLNRLDGGATVRGELDPETAAVVHAGLDACDSGPGQVAGPLPPRSLAERRADAWGDMARHVVNAASRISGDEGEASDGPAQRGRQRTRSGPAPRPPRTVNLVLRAGALPGGNTAGSAIDGRSVLTSAVERLACDSWLAAVLVDARGAVVEATTRIAAFTDTQRRLIAVSDGGCVFPGCDAPMSFCDIHHLHHRADGGGRSLHNGVCLCRRHHTLLHRTWPGGRRWALHRSDDGSGWLATSPTGVTWTGRPDHAGGREPPDHRTAA